MSTYRGSVMSVSDLRAEAHNATSEIEAVVCVPAFRRPMHLKKTLQSLCEQETKRAFAVVVVDNDAEAQESVAVAADFFKRTGMPGLCAVERAQGNCYAINRAFSLGLSAFPTARHFLMIDDDETASPEWLESMVFAADMHQADIVGGPVLPVFEAAAPEWLKAHAVFWPAITRSGPVPCIYGTGNCLIARKVFAGMPKPYFDLRFNFLGGGDMDFFRRCQSTGFRFYWVKEAEIEETVPAERLTARWVLSRGLRIGAVNYLLDWKDYPGAAGRTWVVVKTVLALPASLLKALRRLLQTGRPFDAVHPLSMAVGRTMALLGAVPQPYRARPVK